MEWKKVRLGEIAEIIPGYAFNSSDFGSGDNIVIKIKDIEPPYISIQSADRVNYTPNEKYCLYKNDFVMAMTGATIGKIGRLNTYHNNIFINQRVCKFLPKNNVDTDFLYYLLNTNTFQQYIINNIDSKCAQPNIGHPTLYKCLFSIPPLPVQRRIAGVLSAIDRKIELNRRIIRELEQTARELYDYWFVQFDFPDSHGRPYRASGGKMVFCPELNREIPAGWQVKRLDEIAEIIMGQSPRGKSYNFEGQGMLFYQGCTDFGFIFPTNRMYTTEPKRIATELSLLVSVRAPVGTINIASESCCIGRGLAMLRSKDNKMPFLYCTLKTMKTKFDALNMSGTTFGSITKQELHSLKIISSDVQLVERFNSICKPLFENLPMINSETTRLQTLRSTLLPLLMNGQVTVKE